MLEKTVRVPIQARTAQTTYKGIPVKDAFYTAGYAEGSAERYLEPMNHGDTFVLDGRALKMQNDVLLRTGNDLINLQPEALLIVGSEKEGDFVGYRTQRLPAEGERKFLSSLGLFEEYQMLSGIGSEPHNSKMRTLQSALRRYFRR